MIHDSAFRKSITILIIADSTVNYNASSFLIRGCK